MKVTHISRDCNLLVGHGLEIFRAGRGSGGPGLQFQEGIFGPSSLFLNRAGWRPGPIGEREGRAGHKNDCSEAG